MIKFFYSGCYEKLPNEPVTYLSRLTLHIVLYSLADKFDVAKLGELAIANFREVLTQSWSPGDYLPCVPAIYESTPDSNTGLRRVIVEYAVNGKQNYSRWKMDQSLFEAAFIEAPRFGWDCFLLLQRSSTNKLEWGP